MIQITVSNYFMGRDVSHADELTQEIEDNATMLVGKINALLAEAQADGVELSLDAVTHTPVGSGWRPAGVNHATANAATHSRHITGQACDLRDNAQTRQLCRWAVSDKGREVLDRLDLYCERPQWTPSWLHVQTVPPKSGKRFYVPSSAPAKVPALPGEH